MTHALLFLAQGAGSVTMASKAEATVDRELADAGGDGHAWLLPPGEVPVNLEGIFLEAQRTRVALRCEGTGRRQEVAGGLRALRLRGGRSCKMSGGGAGDQVVLLVCHKTPASGVTLVPLLC